MAAPSTAPSAPPPVPSRGGTGPPSAGDLSLNLSKQSSRTTSAPTSPAKTRESLLQRVQSLTGQARDQGASIIGKLNLIEPVKGPTVKSLKYFKYYV